MPTPTGVVWPCEPHTIAKHQILGRYLEAWYPILMQTKWRSLTYAEGFAGSGVYQNGERGSPVIAADVFLRRRQFLDDGKTMTMVLMEKNQHRLERLQQEMRTPLARYGPPPATFRAIYHGGVCADDLLPALARAGARTGPIFAFLDSFGGPDVPLGIARAIASVPSSEVLVTFGTSFLTRFGGQQAHQESGDAVFGGTAWRDVHDLPAQQKKPFLVTTYRKSLRDAGFTYVISFEMVDDTGHDLHLVFGTSNLTGLEKMKDAMWKVDPVQGVHYRDPRDPDQMTLEFDTKSELGPLRRALLAELLNGDRSVTQLRDHTLTETVYRGPHVRQALTAMLGSGFTERDPAAGQLTSATRIRITARGRQHLNERHSPLF